MALLVTLPFQTPSDSAPLKRCVRTVARSMGMSEYVVLETLTRLSVAIAAEMAAGECVTLMGFGRFGVGILKPKFGRPAQVYPMFYPASGLRNEVESVCTLERAKHPNARMQSYRHSNYARAKTRGRRTFTTGQAMLDVLRVLERRNGGDARD